MDHPIVLKIVKFVKKDPIFLALVLVNYLCFCFTITSISGAWVQYTIPLATSPRATPYATDLKIGLFNSAFNGTWSTYSHSSCLATTNIDQDQIAVCNARVSIGSFLIISLFLKFAVCILMTLLLVRRLHDFRVSQAKLVVIGILLVTGIYN